MKKRERMTPQASIYAEESNSGFVLYAGGARFE
jgi:hypothetical protein